jgi:hypothetical protein
VEVGNQQRIGQDRAATEYLRETGSIEAAYIGISRYMLADWRDYSWRPVWYPGIPAQNTYPPPLRRIEPFLPGSPPSVIAIGINGYRTAIESHPGAIEATMNWVTPNVL